MKRRNAELCKIVYCLDCGVEVQYKTQKPKRCAVHAKQAIARSHKTYQTKVADKVKCWRRISAARKRAAEPEWHLVAKARERAAAKDLPFNLSPEDVVIPKECPILRLPLIPNVGGKVSAPNSPTLDRIIPELGYVKGNIQVISKRANTMKSDASIEELRRFTAWAAKFINDYS